MLLVLFGLVSSLAHASDSSASSFSPVVRLSNGSPLKGLERPTVTGKLVTEFMGIPFAEPPVGPKRFRRPFPKAPWSQVYNATTPPKSCFQSRDTYFDKSFHGAEMWNANTEISEDCLYLNIWVPERVDPKKRLPVMIWIFGGGFWSGTSTLAVYDGKILSTEENVIIVSMNYRVTVFGFLYFNIDEAPGNVGLLDQLEALKWVRNNIAFFGGDPNEVTLFGESAGAASVSFHSISPLSQPYFKKYMLQSGTAVSPWAMKSSQEIFRRGVLFAEAVGCNATTKQDEKVNYASVVDCILRKPPELLLENELQAFEFLDFTWTPVVDNYFLLEEPKSAFENGRFKMGQVLLGSNMDESIYFIVYHLYHIFKKQDLFTKDEFVMSDSQFETGAYNLLPSMFLRNSLVKNAIMFEYRDWELPGKASRRQDALDKMMGDYHFTCNVNEFAEKFEQFGGTVFSYYFTHRASAQTWPAWMGVLHGYEINFIFGEPLNTADFKYTEEEKELSRRFMRYWANFARTGNPNSNVDGSWMADHWPMYTKNQQYLTLSVNSSRIGYGPRRRQCEFWKKYIPQLLEATSDLTEVEIRWKQQFAKWEDEYIVDWKHQFEQYKRLQRYRYYDSQCESADGYR